MSAHSGGHDPALAIDEHRARIEAALPRLAPVELPLERCRGLVLAAPVRARVPVPAFTNSAMDGFAVRAADLVSGADGVVDLPVAGDVPAGDSRANVLAPGTAWRIMTGAPLPMGADTVVRVERTDHGPGIAIPPSRVRILNPVAAGADVRCRGEAIDEGALVLPEGARLGAGALAAVAAAGVGSLLVRRRPRIVVVATGSELVAPGEPLGPGRIPDSNGPMLAALVEESGAEVVARLTVRDDPAALLRLLASAPEADLILTAGGISQGAYEVVRLAIGGHGDFHHVAQQPGGPQGIGVLPLGPSRLPVPALCLPGNPVSVFVSFHVYVAGALEAMAGLRPDASGATAPLLVPGVAAAAWSSPARKTQFVPARAVAADEGALEVAPVHVLGSGSHLATALASASHLALVPEDIDRVASGDLLDLIPVLRNAPSAPATRRREAP
ncbi:molybdopterin molybdotransferase MoeA [Schaalia hyovaginalis]|uniref:Molybdopterin molybdenumtransferase n=1 Tax=Schaalia hyovaginalis TaxID=29316 RepID=A0A923E2R2_9ACTO|nr:gephyrin-like molybdotransferase Glp [Schaalia hyovaginalis]MBB6333813.1 molybdopterin molybdotransferase [Schaalia hyovaginalis]